MILFIVLIPAITINASASANHFDPVGSKGDNLRIQQSLAPSGSGPIKHYKGNFYVEYDVPYGVGTVLDEFGQPYQIDLILDVYRPLDNVSSDRPVMLLIHGGYFGVPGVDKQFPPLVRAAEYFVTRGMVCFSINFRTGNLKPDAFGINDHLKAQWASFVDAKAAVRYIRAHADVYGIDPDRIATMGGSSGAISSLMLAVSDPDDFSTDYPGGKIHPENHPNEDPSVQACFDFWGTCFDKMWGIPPQQQLFGFENEFDPFDDTPIMIVHGTDDKIIPVTDALAIESLCNQNGIYNKLVILVGYDHSAWNAFFGQPPMTLFEAADEFLVIDLGWNF